MTSNLPPGVTESMFPGNTGDDAWFEGFIDAITQDQDLLKFNNEDCQLAWDIGKAEVSQVTRVFLDDFRSPELMGIVEYEGWVWVKTAPEAIRWLETGRIEEIWLDHDLGDAEGVGCGYDVVEWIERSVIQAGFIPPEIIKVHSANGPARDRMEAAIRKIREIAKE